MNYGWRIWKEKEKRKQGNCIEMNWLTFVMEKTQPGNLQNL